jgi:hypothetical protein
MMIITLALYLHTLFLSTCSESAGRLDIISERLG